MSSSPQWSEVPSTQLLLTTPESLPLTPAVSLSKRAAYPLHLHGTFYCSSQLRHMPEWSVLVPRPISGSYYMPFHKTLPISVCLLHVHVTAHLSAHWQQGLYLSTCGVPSPSHVTSSWTLHTRLSCDRSITAVGVPLSDLETVGTEKESLVSRISPNIWSS